MSTHGSCSGRPVQSNNPFRVRHVSSPLPTTSPRPTSSSAAASSAPGPPLPPRRQSTTTTTGVGNGPSPGPKLPPRSRNVSFKPPSPTPTPTPSSSSSSSSVSGMSFDSKYEPTSVMAPSDIMQKSLRAAHVANHVESPGRSIQILKSSTSAPLSPIRHKKTKGLPSPSPKRAVVPKRHRVVEQVTTALRQTDLEDEQADGGFALLARSYQKREPDINIWSPVDILDPGDDAEGRYAMIILNQPIHNRAIFSKAWRASRIRLCADGGANRLYDLWDSSTRSEYLPSVIKGDLDSLRSDVRQYYESMGVPVLQDKDEYSTDLMKCIVEVEKREKAASTEFPLLLMGGLSGRIDQTVHTMSLLYKLREKRPASFVLSCESLAWVLDSGSHLIQVDYSTMGQTCGILPVGVDSAFVKTKGLKWNLDWSTSFDGDISTSNHLLPDEPAVYLSTDKPILWCVEVRGGGL